MVVTIQQSFNVIVIMSMLLLLIQIADVRPDLCSEVPNLAYTVDAGAIQRRHAAENTGRMQQAWASLGLAQNNVAKPC